MDKKSISVILNNDLDGMLEISVSNWSGKVYRIPRSNIENNKIDFLNLPGVYLLICEDEGDYKKVYIGESENIFNRLKAHINKFNHYWNHCYVFMSSDFDKASVRYIEKKFYDLAQKAKTYSVLTEKTPTNIVTSKYKEIEYKEYIKNALMILDMLNINIFKFNEYNDKKINSINNINNQIMRIESNKVRAYGYQSSSGFVVLKGSEISENVTKTFDIYYKSKSILRNELIERKVIVNNQFTMNYEFSSPSAAFVVITGVGPGDSGLNKWKYDNQENFSNKNKQEKEIKDDVKKEPENDSLHHKVNTMKIRSNKVRAYGYQSSSGFVVLKGSEISEKVGKTFDTTYKSKRKQRNQLINDGIIVNNKFTRDYEFKSASSAFIFIVGAPTSFIGLDGWKYDDKVEL